MPPPKARPDTIDVDFVPRFREGVTAIPVQDEAILHEEATGSLHQLDQIAAMVCSLFDGRTSIEGVVSELATAFRADPEVVRPDVLALTRDLGTKGLLEGIQGDEPREEGADSGQ